MMMSKSDPNESSDESVIPTAAYGGGALGPGAQIGPYKLISILGEGGYGIVYLAEREEPVRRRVALKVIKPGMGSKEVIARFEAERQALALLDHPHIAQVYNAGTTDAGHPYFAMEYVKGLPITEHCDREKLSIEQRLKLFQQVCDGVRHAHQKGIIHRDIKPSNILVYAEDDKAIPKIIDFGVAKAISQPLTGRTLYTEAGQFIGTPEYMSPEQAEMVVQDIDTRSDIYSLGAVLYELLTGALPFDSEALRSGGIEHIRRVIREEEPKTPSTRLTSLGEQARKIAQQRRAEVGTLARRLHKELEWIPLKAMRKERAERYRSASELADDIENYLNGAPLIAGPPGIGYKLKKFVRRNRVLVGGIAAVLVVLLAGIAVSTTFAIGQARARAEAQLISDFLKNDVLRSAGKAKVDEATVSFMLDSASKRLDESKLKDKPLIEASIRETLGEIYAGIGELRKGEQHYLHAIRLYRQHLGNEHPDTVRARAGIAYHVYEEQGRYHEMEHFFAKNLQIQQHAHGVEHPVGTMNGLGGALYHLGKYEEAELVLNEALQLEEAWYELGGDGFNIFPYVKGNLAWVYTAQGRYEEAERLFAETGDNEWPAVYPWSLANMYREQGRYGKAEALLDRYLKTQRQKLGDGHYHTLLPMHVLARLYIDQDRYEEATILLSEALPIARRRFRENHPLTLRFVNAYAVLHTKQKQYDQAKTLFDEALQGRQHELGDDHPNTLQTIHDFGVLRREQGQYEEAAKLLTQALEAKQIKLGPDHPAYFESKHELALLYIAQEDYEKAAPLLLDAGNGREAKLGLEHPRTIESLNQLVNLCESWNKPEEAEKWRAKLPRGNEAMQ